MSFEYMSQEGYDKLVAELHQLESVELPQVREAIAEARDKGDLSENFEYHAAKRDKNKNESRIRFLQRMIKTASIIEDDTAENEVGINKKVTVYIPEDDEEETYIFVSTMRQNSLGGLISIESPMGKALLHHKVGDTVHVRVSADYAYPVVIRKVEETDEAENAALRGF